MQQYNIINQYDEFINDITLFATKWLTLPQITTMTFESQLHNIKFNELRDFETMDYFKATRAIPRFECTAGTHEHSSMVYKSITAKSKRGRKPLKQEKRHMHSQITAYVKPSYDCVQYSGYYYKPKIFRNGVIELQGIHLANFHDVLDAMHRLARHFNTNISFIYPKMVNYKFRIKLPHGHCLDLFKMMNIIDEADFSKYGVLVHYQKYNREKVGLNIRFNTTLEKNVCKKTGKPKTIIVKIFSRGKVNIQGPCRPQIVRGSFMALNQILGQHNTEIVKKIPDIDETKITSINNIDIEDNIITNIENG